MRRHEYALRRLREDAGNLIAPPPPEEVKQVLDEYNKEYSKKHGGHGSTVVAMVLPAGETTILLAPLFDKTDSLGTLPGQAR